jgi:hypothetical protein
MSQYLQYSDYDSDKTPPNSPRPLPHVAHRKRSTYRVLPLPPSTPRPLPAVPNQMICKACGTYITNPLLLCKSAPLRFSGYSGRAALFQEIYNANFSKPQAQLMLTGAHTVQLISCSNCEIYLGFKFVKAHHSSEKWKEGRCLLELENLAILSTSTNTASPSSSLLSLLDDT